MSRLLCLALLSAIALPVSAAESQPLALGAFADRQAPDYLLLRAPTANSQQKADDGFYPGRGYGVSTNTYAYGWFGVQPRRHWSRHFGYYRNYTQWSTR